MLYKTDCFYVILMQITIKLNPRPYRESSQMLQHRRRLTGHLHFPLKFSCLFVRPTDELPFVWRSSLHVKQGSAKCLHCLTLVPVWQVSDSKQYERMSNSFSAENVISKINLCSKILTQCVTKMTYMPTIRRDADKSLVRPGRKQARKDVRDPRNCNNIEMRVVIKFF